MARASLWEDTIILAIRDFQWMRHLAGKQSDKKSPAHHQSMPPRLLKMDGRAESKLSDVVTALNRDTFFILEVKSGFSKIRDEWRKPTKGRDSKAAYAILRDLVSAENARYRSLQVEGAGEGQDAESVDPFLAGERPLRHTELSLRGHHFIYWRVDDSDGESRGDVRVEPYISGAARARNDNDKMRSNVMKKLLWKNSLFFDDKQRETIRLTDLDRAEIVVHDDEASTGERLAIGLTASEFDNYVTFLCNTATDGGMESGHEDIHLVFFSTPSGFIKVLKKTSDLVHFVIGHLVPPGSEPSLNARTNNPH